MRTKKNGAKIRVLVVDDSAFMRKLIPKILAPDSQIEVVGTAMDGQYALNKIPQLRPDVVTLDLNMPRMDGLTVLPKILEAYHLPVLVFSTLTRKGAEMTFKALELGAVDFVTKPENVDERRTGQIAEDLISKIKAVARISRRKLRSRSRVSVIPPISVEPKRATSLRQTAARVVAMGISTGGPNALGEILPQLPADFPAGVLIVQHMPEGFTEMFAARMDKMCRVEVKEAKDGDLILPSRVLIAPGHSHLRVKRLRLGYITVLSQTPPISGHRPSVNVLFESVSQEYGPEAIGVIMTGMGEDGTEGLWSMKQAGAITLAQDEDSSVVFGMPKAAIRRGCVDRVLSLEKIVPEIIAQLDQETPTEENGDESDEETSMPLSRKEA